MNELEDKLKAARQEYESLRYPDDLAAQVFPERRTSRWRWAVVVAAAIIVLMFAAPHANGPDPEGTDENTAGSGGLVATPPDPPTLAMTTLPDVSLGDMPSAAAASISGLYQNMLSLVSDFDKIVLDEMVLDDLYKDAEQTEKGLKHLKRLIINQPDA